MSGYRSTLKLHWHQVKGEKITVLDIHWWSWLNKKCFWGLLSGIAGLGGPPFIILALFYTVSRETFIGTYLCARTLVSFTVLITIAITDDTLTSDVVPSIGTTMLGGFCGVTLGQELSKHVKPKVFIKVLQSITATYFQSCILCIC